jgi:acid stress-induced BolA-like protein IbaG/YrbA
MAYHVYEHIVAKTCFMGKRRLKKEFRINPSITEYLLDTVHA